jgi:hypothetical protein
LSTDPNEKDPIVNQCALKVEEVTWAEEVGDAAEARITWERGSEDLREVCVEDANTITAWGFVDCDVALDDAVVGI